MMVAALAALSTLSAAQTGTQVVVSSVTSYDLAQICSKSPSPLSMDFCAGYVLASMDRMSISQEICPAGQTISAVTMAYTRKYISDHPEQWRLHPSELVKHALTELYPCR